MLWALVWIVLGTAAVVVLGLLVRRDVKAVVALLRDLATASEQLGRVSAAASERAATSPTPGVHLPAALGGLRAAESELRRYLDWPSGACRPPSREDGRTMQQQRPPLEV
ncbi:hypothetical protein GTR02_01735 [Kineococcus sp. R8]|uniref:hypothetical protein n=1 Tax=Kineococcus siccus TaxID=2696567 RepID=UPI0014126DED|nr:hypothetical protein [Kineococcus siccus]NAZ80539.1 hypothetical protein [Kineococcus siccus]